MNYFGQYNQFRPQLLHIELTVGAKKLKQDNMHQLLWKGGIGKKHQPLRIDTHLLIKSQAGFPIIDSTKANNDEWKNFTNYINNAAGLSNCISGYINMFIII